MSVSIVVKKLTDTDLMTKACEMTIRSDSHIAFSDLYRAEHSPIRTQLFWIEMYNIPTFVSTHFVRHKIGVEHFILSNREDRGGEVEANRWTPVKHAMLINAEALMTMARKRLCKTSHSFTQSVMLRIVDAVGEIDSELKRFLVPSCIYLRGCRELKSCGYYWRRR